MKMRLGHALVLAALGAAALASLPARAGGYDGCYGYECYRGDDGYYGGYYGDGYGAGSYFDGGYDGDGYHGGYYRDRYDGDGHYGYGYRHVVCDSDGDRCYRTYRDCWDYREYYRRHGYHWED
ncbi:MAG: hypothetical protein JO261_08090 [Alphaproteobacteria bacterium]|nr:hypothetical protein [Alphaproteobacteria bacterium]MBV9693645.1 hypothetical protein [Alphaproteobacteria bacterium]